MIDVNAGFPGDRDRLAPVSNLPISAHRRLPDPRHGLGARICLPGESTIEVDQLHQDLTAELAPRGAMGRILVKRIAVAAVRLDRMVEHEAAVLSQKVRRAETDFDEARLTEADHLLGWISSEPATHHRRLIRTPEGVDRLVSTLRGIRHDLQFQAAETWTHGAHAATLDECTGRRASLIPASRGQVLAAAINGDFRRLTESEADGAGLGTVDRQAWARVELGKLIDGEIERLLIHRTTLDHQAIALDRAEATRRVKVDNDASMVAARRYEAAIERSMKSALRELREVNAEAKARGIEPDAAPIVAPSLLASFRSEGENLNASPLASFQLDAISPLELTPVPPEDPTAQRVASLNDAKREHSPLVVGFVPPGNFTGPAGTGSGAPAGPGARGDSTDYGAHNRH